MRAVVSALFLLALFTGCARHAANEPSASPDLDNKAACESAGGKWKPLTHHCDRD
jgi:hypothetical protein